MDYLFSIITVLKELNLFGVTAWTILTSYVLFGITYIFYCAVMKIRDVWDELHIVIKVLVIPFAFAGLMLDVVVNLVVGSLLSLADPHIDIRRGYIIFELPHEFLFTARLKRWKNASGTRRQRIANFLCDRGLNPIDPHHC